MNKCGPGSSALTSTSYWPPGGRLPKQVDVSQCTSKMNALECRTLTATCMHDSCACICMAHYTCMPVQYQEYWTTYPAPVHLNMVMVLFNWQVSSESLGVGGRHLAMSLYKLKASVSYLNWIMHLRATACLHYHCIDNWPAKHRLAISHVAEVGAM